MNNEIFNFSKASNPELSIIITLKTVQHYDMIERLNYRKLISEISKEKIEFVVVDMGSSNKNDIKRKCQELNFNYIFVDDKSNTFNAGLARNIGAKSSKGKYICHEDIDLIIPDINYYDQLIEQIKIYDLDNNNNYFLSVPVMYLSEAGSKEFLETPINIRRSLFQKYLLEEDTSKFEFFMPASSVIIVNRHHYLSIGGYSEDFNGWGLEDLEYAYRLTRSANMFHTPYNVKQLITNTAFHKQTKYKGWRTQFRLHGELLGKMGIILFHIHHPIDQKWRNKIKHSRNTSLFDQKINDFENGKSKPSLNCSNNNTLIFGKGCFVYNKVMNPLWGNIYIKSYNDFDEISIIEYIKENNINLVVFTNPYANEKRLNTYNLIQKNKIPYYVVERGALNDSIYIDKNGFCCESTSYHTKLWDKKLSISEYQITQDYIYNEVNSHNTLEKQSERLPQDEILAKLGISPNTKILFVPLQSRSDTTVNYFCDDIKDYDTFINLVSSVAQSLPLNWQVIVKHHPLSNKKEDIKNVKFVDDFHIKDLISLSDYILLINSGVGVLATLWNKPVIYTGRAFYASEKLNRKASSTKDVIDIINSNFSPNKEDSFKFVSYLINDFYSFGTMKTHFATYSNRDNQTITDEIEIYDLKLDGVQIYKCSKTPKKIDFTSTIYDLYREDINNTILKKTLPASKTSSQKNKNIKLNKGIVKRKLLKLKNNPKLFLIDAIKNRLN